jgi:hypothetical protein
MRDDRVLVLLREALEEPARRPSAERVEAVRARAVAGRAAASKPASRLRFALATAAILAAFAGGLLLSNSLPRPVQRVASDILPGVESPELSEAQKAIDQLATALDRRDVPAVARARREMNERVSELEPEDRREVEPKARLLDDLAGRFLGPDVGPTVPAAPTPTPSATPSSPFGTGPVATPSPPNGV